MRSPLVARSDEAKYAGASREVYVSEFVMSTVQLYVASLVGTAMMKESRWMPPMATR